MKKKTVLRIGFPNICAALGGAEYADTDGKTVSIKLPGREALATIPARELPPFEKWTAFQLADAVAWRELVAKYEGEGMTRSDAQGCADLQFAPFKKRAAVEEPRAEYGHTPGPWMYQIIPAIQSGDLAQNRARAIHIYSVPSDTVKTMVSRDIQTEQDARLIAAAPDLLAALEMAIRYIVRKEAHDGCMNAKQLAESEKHMAMVSSVSTGRWAGDVVTCDLAQARATIQRAKGGAL